MLKFALLLVPAAILAATTRTPGPSPHAQDRFAQVEIEAIEVRDGIHMLQGSGGNIGLCTGEDGVLMIDDQFAPLAERILAKVKELGDGSAPRFLVNTHHHGDHTGGNAAFGAGATIVAHDNVRRRLRSSEPPAPRAALPTVTYAEQMRLHFNGHTIDLIHYPGCHTDGDTVVHFVEAKVAHLGDLFFSGMFPYVDLDSGGNALRYRAAIEDLCDVLPEDVKIIPGHGPLSTHEDLQNTLDMMRATTQLILERKAEGQSVREIQAAGLPAEWRDWAWNFITLDRWIDIVYRSAKDE